MDNHRTDTLINALSVYLNTALLGLLMSWLVNDLQYLIIVPALLGTTICYTRGAFDKLFGLGETDVSEERV